MTDIRQQVRELQKKRAEVQGMRAELTQAERIFGEQFQKFLADMGLPNEFSPLDLIERTLDQKTGLVLP